jgi:hypothetical protein
MAFARRIWSLDRQPRVIAALLTKDQWFNQALCGAKPLI